MAAYRKLGRRVAAVITHLGGPKVAGLVRPDQIASEALNLSTHGETRPRTGSANRLAPPLLPSPERQ